MLDIKVYLHRSKIKVEPFLFLLAGVSFLLKAYLLFLDGALTSFWFGLNTLLGISLLGFMLQQVISRYKHPKTAAYLSSRIGFMLVVASLIKLWSGITDLQLAFLTAGLLLMFTSSIEESLQKVYALTIDDEGIMVRGNLFNTQCFAWHEIQDLDIKRARVKLTLHNGTILNLRVDRLHTDSTMIRTAQYYSEKLMESTPQRALMVA